MLQVTLSASRAVCSDWRRDNIQSHRSRKTVRFCIYRNVDAIRALADVKDQMAGIGRLHRIDRKHHREILAGIDDGRILQNGWRHQRIDVERRSVLVRYYDAEKVTVVPLDLDLVLRAI